MIAATCSPSTATLNFIVESIRQACRTLPHVDEPRARQLVRCMESMCAHADNANREPYTKEWEDDCVERRVEACRHYNEQADNIAAELR